MSNIATRPWGMLWWLVPKISVDAWTFWGAMATEERCLAAWQFLHSQSLVKATTMVEITDPPSHLRASTENRINQRRTEYQSLGGSINDIVKLDLLTRTEAIFQSGNRVIDQAVSLGGSLILDISCFPKRFFFPYVKMILREPQIRNLVVTYSRPLRYGTSPLAEDVDVWRSIPMFGPTGMQPDKRVLIISLGFEPLSLPTRLDTDLQNISVRLMFPFPPGPPWFQRTWEFMRQLESKLPAEASEPVRVSAVDVSDAFDHLCSFTNRGAAFAELAPYGPKPLSLAMCLYACLNVDRAAVYYTQPSTYNPDYSVGVTQVHGGPEIFAYCVRLNGRNLYT